MDDERRVEGGAICSGRDLCLLLPPSLSEAAGTTSIGKTVAWFTFCLELLLVAHHFCKVVYRMLCSHMRFVQIMTKPIHCSELAGDNK